MRLKFFLLVTFLGLLSHEVLCQQLGFAAETGLTTSRISDNQFRRRYTYHFGVSSSLAITSRINITGALSYVRKGAVFNPNGFGGPGTPSNSSNTGINFDYLEFAALAGFGQDQFQLRIGPTYSYLTQAMIQFGGVDTENITDIINNNEFGVKAGFFYKFKRLESPYITLYYYQGLNDTNFDPLERITSNYFQLSIGYVLVPDR